MATKQTRRTHSAADQSPSPTLTQYVNDAGASHIIAVPAPTLRRWRHEGRGPAYCRLGRLVRYRIADLLAWAKAQEVA